MTEEKDYHIGENEKRSMVQALQDMKLKRCKTCPIREIALSFFVETEIPMNVSNIVMTGKFPLKHKLDLGDFIKNLQGWFVINEETSPIIQKRFERTDGTTSRRTHRKGCVTVSVWPSGAINIVGLRSVREGNETLNKVTGEIRELLQSAGWNKNTG